MHLGLLQSLKYTHKRHLGLPQCHSRQPVQKGQSDPGRVVPHPQMFSLICKVWHKPNGRHICHQNESQNPTLSITSSRCKRTEHRCIEHLGGSGWQCLLSCSSHSKCHSKNEHLQVQNGCSGPRLAQNALVWGSSESVNKTSITATSLASSVKSEKPFCLSEPSCLATRHHSESLKSFSEQVAERIKAPERPSSENCTSQGGPFWTLVPTE